jgi:hypothetical protein
MIEVATPGLDLIETRYAPSELPTAGHRTYEMKNAGDLFVRNRRQTRRQSNENF